MNETGCPCLLFKKLSAIATEYDKFIVFWRNKGSVAVQEVDDLPTMMTVNDLALTMGSSLALAESQLSVPRGSWE